MAADSLHILIANNYTIRGGIPKAVAALANAMTDRGHRVTILNQRPVPRLLFPLYRLWRALRDMSYPPAPVPAPLQGTRPISRDYPLREGIRVLHFQFTDRNLKVQQLRERIRQLDSDVCVCPMADGAHLVWAVTLLGSGVPYVYSERHSPQTIENEFWNRKGRLAAMSGADAIHLLLPSYLDSLPDFLRGRARAIPNAVKLPGRAADPAGAPGARKTLLWLGRLHEPLKQCRMAVDAFALIAQKFPDWDLHIVGDGPDGPLIRAHAKQVAGRHNLEGRIQFLGESGDVPAHFTSAQAYCFSSRTEGMPNALLEGMAAGLPCVAFAGCPGVADIITHGKNGLLAQAMDASSLAGQLERLLADAPLRERLGAAARESMARFSETAVFDAWEGMLREAAAQKGATVMDAFSREPFASMARLSSRARQEWALRDFGQPLCDSLAGRLREAWYIFRWRLQQWL
ncbi:glycosyltransferase [Desulfovibrio sp.]|uniref:glycosyltransferase n=1 Tax=Desulfovibrio sp. TaxID=885 RepID=UPI0025C16E97|nr:glycosyltransferase [Desulfovibrio sp.]